MTPEEHVRAGIAPDIRHWMYDGAYLEMLEKIDPNLYEGIKCVVELGARDCYDSIHLDQSINLKGLEFQQLTL